MTDDNEANQQLIGLRLIRAGAEVVTALNGKEALDRVREPVEAGRPFDAVIMDMQMPVLDGYEAVRQLRAGGFTAPIVAVTAYAMSEDREECLRLGLRRFRQQTHRVGSLLRQVDPPNDRCGRPVIRRHRPSAGRPGMSSTLASGS